MTEIRNNGWFLFAILFGVFVFRVVTAAEDAGTTAECSDDFQKTMTCLDFARGKATTPSKQCCDSVKEIRADDPKCLCYIIQQAHGGSGADTVKSLGVQVSKLLQLPSACQLQNASITLCPKLLGLSPNSPDAAIFTNASSSAAPTTPAVTGTSASPDKASGTVHGPYLIGPTVIVAMAIFSFVFPTGSASLCI